MFDFRGISLLDLDPLWAFSERQTVPVYPYSYWFLYVYMDNITQIFKGVHILKEYRYNIKKN